MTTKTVGITKHAYQRYTERIGKATTMEVSLWVSKAIQDGEDLGKFQDNNRHFVYKGHTIVFDEKKNTVVTITPYVHHLDKDSGYQDIKGEVGAVVSKKLSKQLKVLAKQHRELMITIHKEEIKRLSVFNPETQDIIARRVFKMQEEVSLVENKIESIRLVAEQYGVEV